VFEKDASAPNHQTKPKKGRKKSRQRNEIEKREREKRNEQLRCYGERNQEKNRRELRHLARTAFVTKKWADRKRRGRGEGLGEKEKKREVGASPFRRKKTLPISSVPTARRVTKTAGERSNSEKGKKKKA